MKSQLRDDRLAARVRSLSISVAAIAGLIFASSMTARGATLVEQAHSLRSVPADAAFYSVSLRLQEQLDIFLESQAYAQAVAGADRPTGEDAGCVPMAAVAGAQRGQGPRLRRVARGPAGCRRAQGNVRRRVLLLWQPGMRRHAGLRHGAQRTHAEGSDRSARHPAVARRGQGPDDGNASGAQRKARPFPRLCSAFASRTRNGPRGNWIKFARRSPICSTTFVPN